MFNEVYYQRKWQPCEVIGPFVQKYSGEVLAFTVQDEDGIKYLDYLAECCFRHSPENETTRGVLNE